MSAEAKVSAEAEHADDRFVIGIDFGTLSGRAVVVRVSDGAELGSAVHEYSHAVMDQRLTVGEAGTALPPEWALQVPADYVDVLKTAVPQAVQAAGVDPAKVIGIGTDFTACTMVPVLADGTPLCELPEYVDRPHAYVKLWKHHAAQPQADRINALAASRQESWLPRYGGLISSEWEFAKGLQLLEEDPELYARMDHWVEAADWIVWQLTGHYVRNACTAGYKGIYQDGAYPSPEFLGALNPAFAGFAEDKVAHDIGQLGESAGGLSAQAADLDRTAGGHRRRRRQRRRARHRTRRPSGGAGADGGDHGHLDLPRHELEPARGCAGNVRSRRRRHRVRALRVRGRAIRRRRHFRLVCEESGAGQLLRSGARRGHAASTST